MVNISQIVTTAPNTQLGIQNLPPQTSLLYILLQYSFIEKKKKKQQLQQPLTTLSAGPTSVPKHRLPLHALLPGQRGVG